MSSTNQTKIWYVVGFSDYGGIELSSMRFFEDVEDANDYCKSISPKYDYVHADQIDLLKSNKDNPT